MNFLLCSPQSISQNMGISRVLIEIQKELIKLGHQCDLVGPKDIGCDLPYSTSINYLKNYSSCLKNYIKKNCHKYDVVDIDHEFLPYSRSEFDKNILLVARTVLLVQHLENIKIPKKSSLKNLIGLILKGLARAKEQKTRIEMANKTFACADLINVPNQKDREHLIKIGIEESKIVVIPYGLSNERSSLFHVTKPQPPDNPIICFIGTFDYRKGAIHFSEFFSDIQKKIPEAKLRLIGCKGMFQTQKEILNFFPNHLHSKIEVILTFDREKIAEYLKDCSIGIFPSYMEGFPFGVLEMMSAHLPVLAFDSPGAGMMVPSEHLFTPGDMKNLSQKAVELLQNKELLTQKRIEAKSRVVKFTWEEVTKETIGMYDQKSKG